MKSTSFRKMTVRGAAAGLTLLAVSLIMLTGGGPASAQNGRNGQIHIVKDCGKEVIPPLGSAPGSDFCVIVSSNLPELPAGTRIHYGLDDGPKEGAKGFFDQNIFVYVSDSQWAVGRCTGPNDFTDIPLPDKAGLCTLSDGRGALAGLSTRMVVTYLPVPGDATAGGDTLLFRWDGTYSFESLPKR